MMALWVVLPGLTRTVEEDVPMDNHQKAPWGGVLFVGLLVGLLLGGLLLLRLQGL